MKKINIGKYKVLFDRMRNYAQLINSAILFFLLLNETGFKWFYLLVIPLLAILLYFDHKTIIAQERDYIWSRPGTLKDLVRDVRDIKKMINKDAEI